MKIKVEIKAQQIFKEQVDKETNGGEGEITYLPKGEVIEFIEKKEQEEIHFKFMIAEDKIISIREGQQLIFDKNKEDHVLYQTPYGNVRMKLHTKEIQIQRKDNKIEKIILDYTITLPNEESYENHVEISVKEEC